MANEANEKALLTVIVLTRDEAFHLPRLIASFEGLRCRFVIVDSGSTDGTGNVARELGAEVHVHPFETHARQFNWALENIPIATPWTMRMDADEYLLPGLVDELAKVLPTAPADVGGWVDDAPTDVFLGSLDPSRGLLSDVAATRLAHGHRATRGSRHG